MFIDILLLIIFLVIAATGFFQGTIKILIAILSFYASVVLASLYFKFMALAFARSGTSPIVADSLSFFLILAICFILLLAMALYTFRYVRIPVRLEFVDRLLGLVFGVILGVVFTSILAMMLHYAFVTHSAGDLYPLTRAIQNSTRTSTFRQLLIFNILPQMYTVVSPFLPDAALPFFNPRRV
jgi:uncharacterized membrane protein required for colicin V production